ncbi:adenylate/guanylate cyclase domain-containing protein [Variovorax sp. J22R24]|uniref:ATP-binding protein n=1 Tax=Variovorax gracilis TaxID=3053502 RepID=UPI00257652FF|nr:adenylate/guanylate cyclase domain-containing protein [Variovorax sp. J22R24]MDM0105382.1 adenylate/guanylate cyclase domain-containing protein [Variovorax sp. J22R24]
MLSPSTANPVLEPPERRFLTIVFIDLIGYTALSERLDPEELSKLQRTYQMAALQTMERYEGFVARFVGDGILVYFGYPRAHERDAERAVRAALELVRRLNELKPGLVEPAALDTRIGIHSGLVVVAQELMSAGASAPGIVGEAANLAARLQADAPPGGILISSDTLDLVEGLADCEPLGPRRFKGLSKEIEVYKVRGIRSAAGRPPSSFQRGSALMVGRAEPLTLLLGHWDAVRSSRQCRTIAVVAEAGSGKSRLGLEFSNRAELADAMVLKVSCHEIFSRTPLYPVAHFLWSRAGLSVEDSPADSALKVSAVLATLGLSDEENSAIAMSLLGLAAPGATEAIAPSPQILRRMQYEFVTSAFKSLSARESVVLWVEDTHWLDPSTAELLQEVVTILKDAPALVLLTMRSFPPGPALPPADEIMHLEKLGESDCRQIAMAIPGAEMLPADVIEQAVRSSDGLPLFVEQLVMALLDERVQGNQRNRRLGGVPLMLAEMLSERLDRLPGGRRIVQAAACIGRSFVPEFLLTILEQGADQVARPLEELVTAEILEPKRFGVEIRYQFCHALLQRMAYESMLQDERQAMHGRIVDVLRQHFANRPIPQELIAHHLTEAGRTVDAAQAWLEAGASAAGRSANVEAIDHLRRGIALLDKVQDAKQRRELELKMQVTMMGSILAAQSATSPELQACCERGLALCAEGEPSPLIFPLAFGKFTHVNCLGRAVESEQLARMFLHLSERNGFDSGRVIGHRMLGMSLMVQARAVEARAEIDRSLALYVPERDAATTRMFGQNTEVHSKSLLSFTLFCLGDVDQALVVGVDALRTADALRHPHSTAIPLVYVGGWVFGMCGATEAMRAESRRLLQLAEEHRLRGFRAHGMGFFGWALCQRGQLAQGIAAIEQAVAAFDSVSFRLSEAGHLANLADAQRRFGRLREAASSGARAIELVTEGGQWQEPEVLRVAGLIAAEVSPHGDEAEEKLRLAVAAAQRMGFPVLERNCLVTLSHFLAKRQPDAQVDARLGELSHLDQLDKRVERVLSPSAT